MNLKEDLKYTKDHEWVKAEGDFVLVGITDFAQAELGEIVYVEVDTVGETIEQGDIFGTIEAVKTTSDLFMPISGKVVEFNSKLDENEDDQPDFVNSDPYGEGWIIKIEATNPEQMDELMDPEAYKEIIS